MVRLVVTGGGSLSRRPKWFLRCLLVDVPLQINEYENLKVAWELHDRKLFVLNKTLLRSYTKSVLQIAVSMKPVMNVWSRWIFIAVGACSQAGRSPIFASRLGGIPTRLTPKVWKRSTPKWVQIRPKYRRHIWFLIPHGRRKIWNKVNRYAQNEAFPVPHQPETYPC